MKHTIMAIIGALGAAISTALGGWTSGLTTLIVFMAIDYASGLIVAGGFHKSGKSETGRLESGAGWKGLIRKGMILLIVLIACRLDMLLGTTYIRDAVVIAFCANELLSITENAGLMGVPIPKAITGAIEVLKKRESVETETDHPPDDN